MALFFIFAMLLGAALQLTNAYGDTFLHDFAKMEKYKDAIAVKYPAIIMSISQMSETLFILAIPFFLKRFGIKKVMLISMVAWVFRFALFGFGNPDDGLWMIILSCIIYGMAFDFFNISGSLFVETQANTSIRASAQGVFMMMTNGVGALLGSSDQRSHYRQLLYKCRQVQRLAGHMDRLRSIRTRCRNFIRDIFQA